MTSAEERYGRPEATRSINTWGYSQGKNTVTPTVNLAAYLKNDNTPQESGKPDLLVCLRSRSRVPYALGVEVKGYCGSLCKDTLRKNQEQWALTMSWPYFIFIWGYEDDEIPEGGFRTKEARARRHAYLVNLIDWQVAWDKVDFLAGVKVVRHHYTKHHRKALRDNNLTIDNLFGDYELERDGSIWVMRRDHPVQKQLDLN